MMKTASNDNVIVDMGECIGCGDKGKHLYLPSECSPYNNSGMYCSQCYVEDVESLIDEREDELLDLYDDLREMGIARTPVNGRY